MRLRTDISQPEFEYRADWAIPEDHIARLPHLLPQADTVEGKLLSLHRLQQGLSFARPQAGHKGQTACLPHVAGHHIDVGTHLQAGTLECSGHAMQSGSLMGFMQGALATGDRPKQGQQCEPPGSCVFDVLGNVAVQVCANEHC